MIKVLLDNDVDGFQWLLSNAIERIGWSEFGLVEFVTLKDFGLSRAAKDREIWRFCQQNSLILFTANRNREDPDSLECTLTEENTPSSLPVLTISNQKRLRSSAYREACVERLLNIILDLSNYLGTGRLFIP
jgi:predicted nuclease of predicted toxin-antitoxin system